MSLLSPSPMSLRLLDLPEETLARIFSHLQPSSSTNSRFFLNAQDAFSLATCNTRLLHIFSHNFAAISTRPPHPISPDTQTCSTLSISHLSQLIRLAGPALRVLHLPLSAVPHFGALLLIAARNCPHLQEVSYCSSVNQGAEKIMLQALHGIRRMHVSGGASLFENLIHTERLEQLRITDILPESRETLQNWLTCHAGNLRQLSVAFSSRGNDHLLINEAVALCEYLSLHLSQYMPSLEELEISVKTWPHDPPNTISQMVAKAEDIVNRARYEFKPRCGGFLRVLRINGHGAKLITLLENLTNLIDVHTEVEAHTSQIGFVIPGMGAAPVEGQKAWFKSFYLSGKTLEYAVDNEDKFSQLKCISLANDRVRWAEEALQKLLSRAGPSIRHIHEGTEISSHPQFCTVLTDVMENAQGVTFLAICCRTIELLYESGVTRLANSVRAMRNIKTIHLRPTPSFSFPRRRYNNDYARFVESLRAFLEAVEDLAPNIEVIYMTAVDLRGPVEAPMAKSLGEALAVVERLQMARPRLDAQTLEAQLRHWVKMHADGQRSSPPLTPYQ